MKLLPKKTEIDKAKAAERKMEIDEGMNLARQVDDLRRIKAEEERNILDYRNGMMKAICVEIDSLIEDRDNLFKSNAQARLDREALLEPLDKEWQELNLEKESLGKEKEELFVSREALKIEAKNDRETKKMILSSIAKSRKAESDARKLFDEAILFKENAESECRMATFEHDVQNDEYGKRLKEIELARSAYQNGINVNLMDEQRLSDWEKELIIREQALERGRKTLQIAKEELEHGSTNSGGIVAD